MATMNCARSCSPVSEEERQSIMKWSENIENLLKHDPGRERYKKYLALLDLEEDLDCITFWEMAEDLELLSDELLKNRGSPSLEDEASQRNRFNAKLNNLIQFAVENINFDMMELQKLTSIKNNPVDCKTILPKARASVYFLLKPTYEEFIKNQISERLSNGY